MEYRAAILCEECFSFDFLLSWRDQLVSNPRSSNPVRKNNLLSVNLLVIIRGIKRLDKYSMYYLHEDPI